MKIQNDERRFNMIKKESNGFREQIGMFFRKIQGKSKRGERMKKILIVDDEEDMIWSLQKNLRTIPDADVRIAKSGEAAQKLLDKMTFDIVITDVRMPGISGLDLLVFIKNKYPDIKVIIMTAFPSVELKKSAAISGCINFIEKPFDIEEFRSFVTDALEDTKDFKEVIRGLKLLDVIQINCLSGITSAAKVIKDNKRGLIFFKDGAIIHAVYKDLLKEDAPIAGEEAILELLKFDADSIQILRGAPAVENTISTPWETLITQATKEIPADDFEHEAPMERKETSLSLEEWAADDTTGIDFADLTDSVDIEAKGPVEERADDLEFSRKETGSNAEFDRVQATGETEFTQEEAESNEKAVAEEAGSNEELDREQAASEVEFAREKAESNVEAVAEEAESNEELDRKQAASEVTFAREKAESNVEAVAEEAGSNEELDREQAANKVEFAQETTERDAESVADKEAGDELEYAQKDIKHIMESTVKTPIENKKLKSFQVSERGKEKEGEMKKVGDTLNVLSKLDGVSAVSLVGRDGFLLDSIAKKGIDAEMIGAIASGGFGASESMGKQLEKGNLTMTMLEYNDGPVILAPVGDDAFLVVAAEENANLALIRLSVKKYKDRLVAATEI